MCTYKEKFYLLNIKLCVYKFDAIVFVFRIQCSVFIIQYILRVSVNKATTDVHNGATGLCIKMLFIHRSSFLGIIPMLIFFFFDSFVRRSFWIDAESINKKIEGQKEALKLLKYGTWRVEIFLNRRCVNSLDELQIIMDNNALLLKKNFYPLVCSTLKLNGPTKCDP